MPSPDFPWLDMRYQELPANERSSQQRPNGQPSFGVIHCTDNTASDEGEAGYAARRSDFVNAHAYFDADDTDLGIQVLRVREIAWGAGPIANQRGVHCEITGRSSWSRANWLAQEQAIRNCAMFLGACAAVYSWAPFHLTVRELLAGHRGIVSHADTVAAWHQTDHTDPGPNFPWDLLMSALSTGYSLSIPHVGGTAPSQEGNIPAMPTLLESATGIFVVRLQALINVYLAMNGKTLLAEDGEYGPKTSAAVMWVEEKYRIPNSVTSAGRGDGIVGPSVWTWLLTS